jgi:hypothetical protein
MTPKEKAAELVDRFTFADIYFTDKINGAKLNAKQCALIAVQEIIKHRPVMPSPIACVDYDACIEQAKDYWLKVKEEIEKL